MAADSVIRAPDAKAERESRINLALLRGALENLRGNRRIAPLVALVVAAMFSQWVSAHLAGRLVCAGPAGHLGPAAADPQISRRRSDARGGAQMDLGRGGGKSFLCRQLDLAGLVPVGARQSTQSHADRHRAGRDPGGACHGRRRQPPDRGARLHPVWRGDGAGAAAGAQRRGGLSGRW